MHSPVNLDPELKAAMDALGPVKHIVTPNFEHNKFAQQARISAITMQRTMSCHKKAVTLVCLCLLRLKTAAAHPHAFALHIRSAEAAVLSTQHLQHVQVTK